MNHPASPRSVVAAGAPVLALLLYCGLAFYQLPLPGFYYDEALDLPPTLQLAHGQSVELASKDPGVTILGATFPLMILDYLGAVNTYLLWPVFAAAGASWLTVRWFEVAVSAVVVSLSYRLARAWFGPAVAAVAALLVAVNPSFVFWSRMGISVSSVMSLCSLGSLLAIRRWKRTGRGYWLGATGLLLGIGLWAKFLFLWWIAALAVAYALVEWRRWRPSRERLARGEILGLHWKAWGWGALGFIAGAGPLIYYNALTGNTVEILADALKAPTSYGVNNRQILDNLKAALDQLRIFLDGSYFWYNGEIQSNPWAYPIFWVSLALTAGLMWGWASDVRRRAAATAIIVGAIVFQSAFTVSGIWATHLYILAPFLQIIVALAGMGAWQWAARRRSPLQWLPRAAGALLIAGLFAGDLATTWRYHATLAKYGGLGRFSDAIYKLADYLDENQITSPAMLDWGLAKNILILTDGRVQPVEIFGYSPEPPPGFKSAVEAYLCAGCAFVNVDQAYAVFPRDDAFRQFAAEAGYEVVIEESSIFRERSGQAAYVVYRVRPGKNAP